MILTGVGIIASSSSSGSGFTLTLEWDDVFTSASAFLLDSTGSGDVNNVSTWSQAFGLQLTGNPFTSVSIPDSNHVVLKNPNTIQLMSYLFYGYFGSEGLQSIADNGMIQYVGENAFQGLTGLNSVSLPACTQISDYSFSDCSNLSSVSMDLLTLAGAYSFGGCISFLYPSFPNLTVVQLGMFYNCGLDTVNLPVVTIIDVGGFLGSSLTSISLPLASNIGAQAFKDCSALTTVNLPQAITIGNEAFQSSSSLVSIYLPSVTSVGEACFQYCYGLVTVGLPVCTNLGGSVLDNSVFDQIASPSPTGIVTLTIPESLMTCNSGSPDGDIQYLLGKTTVSIIHPIQIGTQTWSLRNLDVTRYSNGSGIAHITDPTDWQNADYGAWCYYDNNPANSSYGKLYNWHAVNDIQDLAPDGWHIPSFDEYQTLLSYLSTTYDIAPPQTGGLLKETGTAHWNSPNTDATNLSGFTAFGAGIRYSDGTFDLGRDLGAFWTSTENPSNPLDARSIALNASNIFVSYPSGYTKNAGFSIRLIKD